MEGMASHKNARADGEAPNLNRLKGWNLSDRSSLSHAYWTDLYRSQRRDQEDCGSRSEGAWIVSQMQLCAVLTSRLQLSTRPVITLESRIERQV